MKNRLARFALSAFAVIGLTSGLRAATTATQNYTVNVPVSISITAPSAASLTHDETDNPQAFPAQTWTVRGNNSTGVTVTFATAQPFVHATNNTFKRNARLELALGTVQGPASWTVTTAADETNYTSNDNVAQVAAESNGVGRANFNLTVKFMTEEFGVFAAGAYSTTVTGTVTAK
jgi:hypothetical protein